MNQLTLWEVNDLFLYWHEYPPVHVLAAAYLLQPSRVQPTRRKTVDASNRLLRLKQTVAAAGGTIRAEMPEIYRKGSS